MLDMDVLKKTNNVSGFINMIFLNSYETSSATINHSIGQQKNYPKDITLKVRLQNDVFDILNPFIPSHCPEAEYYSSRAAYIKAILEDYARKSFSERVKICYADTIQMLEYAILLPQNEKKIFQITYLSFPNTEVNYDIKPYKIQYDTEFNFPYLLCLASCSKSSKKDYKPSAFRISKISRIHAYSKSYGSGKITKTNEQNITTSILEKSIYFLDEDIETIKVSLTPTGWIKYNTLYQLRPFAKEKVIMPSGNTILEFRCSRKQILYYFFNFGKEAVILEPKELQNEFRKQYKEALENYVNMD